MYCLCGVLTKQKYRHLCVMDIKPLSLSRCLQYVSVCVCVCEVTPPPPSLGDVAPFSLTVG